MTMTMTTKTKTTTQHEDASFITARSSVVPMIDYNRSSIVIDHRLVSANDQVLDYDVHLSIIIINQNYVQINFFRFASQMSQCRRYKTASTFTDCAIDHRSNSAKPGVGNVARVLSAYVHGPF